MNQTSLIEQCFEKNKFTWQNASEKQNMRLACTVEIITIVFVKEDIDGKNVYHVEDTRPLAKVKAFIEEDLQLDPTVYLMQYRFGDNLVNLRTDRR